MIIIIYNPASLIPVISNYDIWFIGLFFSTCVDCQLSLVHFLQQFLVRVQTICLQMSRCYNSGISSDGYMMLLCRVF